MLAALFCSWAFCAVDGCRGSYPNIYSWEEMRIIPGSHCFLAEWEWPACFSPRISAKGMRVDVPRQAVRFDGKAIDHLCHPVFG